ncbi:PepSY domain-containing protein [Corynebacterium flavescens]|uniref:PepSY domain-containing protein n=1 Tax=Corynebacterium flavescens TaxID=28028 RepID=UPI003FD60A76
MVAIPKALFLDDFMEVNEMKYNRVLAGTCTVAFATVLAACGSNSASQPEIPTGDTVTVTESPREESPAPDAAGAEISADEAFAIAFADSGVAADAARDREAELDTDDGRRIWELEFSANGMDYDYDIDAVSKEIVHVDNDRDNH